MIEHAYFREPTPHIFFPQILPPDVYAQLRFPHIEKKPDGRIGRDLYGGEPGYAELIASPGWRELSGLVRSEQFVKWLLSIFAEDLARLRCMVDPAKAYLEHYVEPREAVKRVTGAIDDKEPNCLFTRFDIQAADSHYRTYVHLDHIRRLTGGLLFCADHLEEGLEGGEFALYRDRFFGDDRRCMWPALAKTFPVRHNTGVIFLNANTAFHGPRPTRKLRGLRKWVYYSLSSHQAIWPHRIPTAGRLAALKAANRVQGVKTRIFGQG